MSRIGVLARALIAAAMAAGADAAAAEQTADPSGYEDPSVQYSRLRFHPEVEVTLFAHEPMIANPIQMAWDPQGRLWVICSYAYPQLKPGEAPNDKLIILEDTTGDGKADKRTVFADGLLVPTGFELGDGGAYVANQPELLFLRDTTGDGKADERRVVLSGFGTEDNHHAISTWRWGPGGHLYFQSGIFLNSQIETPYGVVRLQDGGVFQWRPRRMELKVYAQANEFLNPWGHAFDRWGQNFLTEAPAGHFLYLTPAAVGVRPKARYPQMEGAPKSCGIEFFSGPHWPEDWQGQLVLNAFRNKQVLRYALSDDSSGYAAREVDTLISSREPNFRPVDVKQGPDGAMYIADWYNPIIGHMQYNFRDPRRDKKHGRIWRMAYKGGPALEWPDLLAAPTPALLDYLKAPEDNLRHQVRRVLYDRDAEAAAAALEAWVERLDPEHPDFEHHRLEALWSYETIDVYAGDLLEAVLASPDYRARAAAVRVLRHWRTHVPGALARMETAVNDPHPRVRLEAVTALSDFPDARAMETAAMAVDHAMDRYLDFALELTANALRDYWLPAFERGEISFGDDLRRLEYCLRAVPAEEVVAPLLDLYESGALPAARRVSALALAAGLAGPEGLARVFTLVLEEPSVEALEQLAAAARGRDVRPASGQEHITALFAHASGTIRGAAYRLAGAWGAEAARPALETLLRNPEAESPERIAAAEAIADLGGDAAQKTLSEVAGGEAEPLEVRLGAAGALVRVHPESAADAAAALLAAAPDGTDPAGLLAAFLQRRGGVDALTAALERTERLPGPDTAKLAQRYLFNVGREIPELTAVFNRAAGIDGAEEDLSPEAMAALMAAVENEGNAHRGEWVYRAMDCAQCHPIAGAGGRLGPELAGLGTGATLDYIIESILLPDAAVREGYEGVEVTTHDWEVYSGILLRESADTLVLRDAIRDEIAIAKSDIEERREIGSLMPGGWMDTMTRAELVDLVRFITELGRPGDFAAPNIPVVRRWRTLGAAPEEVAAAPNPAARGAALHALTAQWLPAYSLVSGKLPVDRLEGADASFGTVYVYAEVEATTPGPVRLALGETAGVSLWLGPEPVALDESGVDLDLPRGMHRFYFAVDPSVQPRLRAMFEELPGSPGRVRIIGGR